MRGLGYAHLTQRQKTRKRVEIRSERHEREVLPKPASYPAGVPWIPARVPRKSESKWRDKPLHQYHCGDSNRRRPHDSIACQGCLVGYRPRAGARVRFEYPNTGCRPDSLRSRRTAPATTAATAILGPVAEQPLAMDKRYFCRGLARQPRIHPAPQTSHTQPAPAPAHDPSGQSKGC